MRLSFTILFAAFLGACGTRTSVDLGGGESDAGAGTPCCREGEGWGGIPRAGGPTCEGCCAGLAIVETGIVGAGDIAYACEPPGGGGAR